MHGLLAWLKENVLLSAIVFVSSFLLPFTLTVFLGSDSIQNKEDTGKIEKTFPGSLAVNDQGIAYKIPDNPDFSPSGEGDLLFVVWFKLRKPIPLGERIILVGKYKANSKMRPGYSLGIARDADGARPILYWQSPDLPGKWYSFSPAMIDNKDWHYLAFSFRSSRYLGVHFGTFGKSEKPELLGGYDLESEVLAKSNAPLVVGAFGGSRFRGRIGPLGIIKARNLTESLSNLLAEFQARPGEFPKEIGSDAVKLWVKDGVDISQYKNQIEILSVKPGSEAGDGAP